MGGTIDTALLESNRAALYLAKGAAPFVDEELQVELLNSLHRLALLGVCVLQCVAV
eukprot:CAMPEP_0173113904 /NCGR_PEP_ID=MMETSP1102-20130122/47235_1 /TAXON_ID=49646 /ORGANISM="Geminigera sp., Strain Caron Lab Isolate" /LENGTH=55 /DNA_ID=CAMNT_0014015943 /DNA_START=39 /DNA_END=203 /DNA_ORIENTATION=+